MAQEDPNALLLAQIGQKVLLVKDGKVLMCRGTVDFKEMDKRWDFPGGRMHTGEQPIPALKRELKEEFGVEFEIRKPLLTCITYDTPNNVPRYYVVFEASLLDPSAPFTIPEDEISEIKWVSPEEVEMLVTWEDWRTLLRDYFKTHAS